MRAIESSAPNALQCATRAVPRATRGSAVVAVSYCGVCATDLEIIEGRFWGDYPVIPGHEISGVIHEVEDVDGAWNPGDRVVVDPNIPCLACEPCSEGQRHLCARLRAIGVTEPGGFAEFVRVPLSNLYAVPSHLPLRRAAAAEPLACVLHGIDRASPTPEDRIVIYGAGFIGLLFAAVLQSQGIRSLTLAEPSPERARLAAALGYNTEVPALRSQSLAIDCSGNPQAIEDALARLSPGGRLLLFGVADPDARVSLSPYEAFRRELTILGSFINPDTQQRAVEWLSRFDIEPLMTHTFPLERFEDALRVRRSDPAALKILISPKRA